MKKVLLIFIAGLTLASCSKKQHIADVQTVTYSLKCADCLIYLEDDKWNRDNEQDRSKYQAFNVSGQFRYSFVNKSRDEVSARIYVSVFSNAQVVELEISESLNGKKAYKKDTLGYRPFHPSKFEETLTLRLK